MSPSLRHLPARWCALALLVLILAGARLTAAVDPMLDDRMIMEAKINGQPVLLQFDTGAADLTLFRQSAERLHLHVPALTPGLKSPRGQGQTPGIMSEPLQLQLGNRTFTTQFFVVESPTMINLDIDGALGWGPLSANVFVIGGAERGGKLRVRTALLPEAPAGVEHLWQLPLRPNSDVLLLDLPGPAGHPDTMLVDTGAEDGVTLSPAKWREWKTTHPDAPTTLGVYFTPSSGFVVNTVAWARELHLGPLTLTDVPVSVDLSGETAFDVILGLYALKRVDLMVDGRKGVAYFQPAAAVAPPYPHNRLGAVFVPHGPLLDPLVAQVIPGTPAAEAGIRDGDLLLKIGPRDVTHWRSSPVGFESVVFWNNPAGLTYSLTLMRGDREFTTVVKLRDIIGPQPTPAGTKPTPGR